MFDFYFQVTHIYKYFNITNIYTFQKEILINIEYNINKQVEELRTTLNKTKNIRMYKRYSVILKHFEGFSNKEIAKIEYLEAHTVDNYINL
jgi:DNA-binding NarL/FixJ family response regulator